METLSRERLTATLAVRQMLSERRPLDPVEAVRRLTPLQGQEPDAPHVALAARLEGFRQDDLNAAFEARAVVKTTINRFTLHIAAAEDYPAYAQLTRQVRMRAWRKTHRHLDEEEVAAELSEWLAEPRTNAEIHERVLRYGGVREENLGGVAFARTLLPLVQLPPAGFWRERSRARFVVDQRPLPDPADAAELVAARYLEAYGPASRRDLASWAGVAQRDFAAAWERLETVSYRDENGVELLDLPGRPLAPADTELPVRFLSRWEQPLLAYADRDRIIPPALQPLKLTLSGDQTVTVDGRVIASWGLKRSARALSVLIEPHAPIPRRARAELRAEAQRIARFCEPQARKVEVEGM